MKFLYSLAVFTLASACTAARPAVSEAKAFGRFPLCDVPRIPGLAENVVLENSYKNVVMLVDFDKLATECPGAVYDKGRPLSADTLCILRHGGTGFFLSEGGFIATNFHVARHCGNFDPAMGHMGEEIRCLKDQSQVPAIANLTLAAVKIEGFTCAADGQTIPQLSDLLPVFLVAVPPIADFQLGSDYAVLKLAPDAVPKEGLRCLKAAPPSIGEKVFMTGFPGDDRYDLPTLKSRLASLEDVQTLYRAKSATLRADPSSIAGDLPTLASIDATYLAKVATGDLSRKIHYYDVAIAATQAMIQNVSASFGSKADGYVSSDRSVRTAYGHVTALSLPPDMIGRFQINLAATFSLLKDSMSQPSPTVTLSQDQRAAVSNWQNLQQSIDNRVDWPTSFNSVFAQSLLDGRLDIVFSAAGRALILSALGEAQSNPPALSTLDPASAFATSVDNAGGFSGSPIYDESGAIIGLNELKVINPDLDIYEQTEAMLGYSRSFDGTASAHIYSSRLLSFFARVDVVRTFKGLTSLGVWRCE